MNNIFQGSQSNLVKQVKEELVATFDTGKRHVLKDFDSLVLNKTKSKLFLVFLQLFLLFFCMLGKLIFTE